MVQKKGFGRSALNQIDMKTLALVSLFALLFFPSQFSKASSVKKIQSLTNVLDGSVHSIAFDKEKRGQIIVFLSTRCPCSNSHIPILKALAAEFSQYQFIGIHSNRYEDGTEAKAYFSEKKLPFPVLADKGQLLANELGATRTPHTYLIDQDGNKLYRGAVTNSSNAAKASENHLRAALLAHSDGREIERKEARPLGCEIDR